MAAGPDFRPSGRGRPCRLPAARREPASRAIYIGIIEEKMETTIMGYRAKALETGSALDHGGRAACSGLLTFLVPIKPKWVPNCADDASVRGARARLVQKHHRHNWDPILGRFQLN